MPTPRKSAKQVREILTNPGRAITDSRYWLEPTCRRWLDHSAERIHLNIPEALRFAIIGVRLARRVVHRQKERGIRHQCVLARAFGVLGSAYCAGGELKKASHALNKAKALAANCTDLDERSNTHRLCGILHAYLAQRPDGAFDLGEIRIGLDFVDVAVREAVSPLAEARALSTRALLHIREGALSAAVTDARHSLEILGASDDHWNAHASATSMLISALARGNANDRREAIEHLEKLREALPRRAPAHRARLLWAEALIHVHDPRRKPRARHRLDQARRKFLKLKMQAEAIAVTADLARLNPAGPVPTLCDELLAILDPGPIRELVAYLRNARFMERVDLAEQLRRACQGPGLLPAAAWPNA